MTRSSDVLSDIAWLFKKIVHEIDVRARILENLPERDEEVEMERGVAVVTRLNGVVTVLFNEGDPVDLKVKGYKFRIGSFIPSDWGKKLANRILMLSIVNALRIDFPWPIRTYLEMHVGGLRMRLPGVKLPVIRVYSIRHKHGLISDGRRLTIWDTEDFILTYDGQYLYIQYRQLDDIDMVALDVLDTITKEIVR